MNIKDYSEQALATDVFHKTTSNLTSPAFIEKILGLVGEAGEVAEKFKKIIRDNQGEVGEADKAAVIKELGDVLWYINAISAALGVPLEEVARINLEKVNDRKQRGVSKGQGDER